LKNIDLSIIVPLYNEDECVHYLYKAIIEAVDPLSIIYEIIFVDDGSKDHTFDKLKDNAKNDKRVRVIKFRKNYGQTSAMAAGISHANGKILVTMDGDLQNDPTDIEKFLKKMEEGHDIVCGWRHKRRDDLITRKIPSLIANWIIGKITGVPIKDNGCSLKAYRAEIIKQIPLYSDMHRFIPAMTSMAGINVAELKVKHHARKHGTSKYGISRIYKVIIDLLVIKMILSFSANPIRFFGMAGFFTMVIGLILLLSPIMLYGVKFEFDFMFASGALLFFILSLFLTLVGLLGELCIKMGNIKHTTFLRKEIY
jgi:glycosyltransferase involved in cell wall biosynthesis